MASIQPNMNMNMSGDRCPPSMVGMGFAYVADLKYFLSQTAERHRSLGNYATSAAFFKEMAIIKHSTPGSALGFLDQSKTFRLEIAQMCYHVAVHAEDLSRRLWWCCRPVKNFAEALAIAHEALDIRKKILGLSATLTIESALQVATMEYSAAKAPGDYDRVIVVCKVINWDGVVYSTKHTDLFVKTSSLLSRVFEKLGDQAQAKLFLDKVSKY